MKTLYDLFSHLLDVSDSSDDPVNRRRAKRAAIYGALQTQLRHQWANYSVTEVTRLNAPLTVDATITAGGLVTLDDAEGDLPDWVASGSVQYDDHTFVIDQRLSATELQLAGWGLGAIASNTSITIVNDRYTLNGSVREVFEVRNETSDIELYDVGPARFRIMQHAQNGTPSDPIAVTEVVHTGPSGQRTELRFVPAPSVQTDVSVSYLRHPRQSNVLHSCGSTGISDTTATLSTPLPFYLLEPAGLVLLISETASEPEPSLGFGVDDHSPQISSVHRVSEITDSTTLELQAAVASSITGKSAILTHELDIPEFAFTAACRFAEAEFARVGHGNLKTHIEYLQAAEYEMRIAMEQEGRMNRRPAAPRSRSATYTAPENVTQIN